MLIYFKSLAIWSRNATLLFLTLYQEYTQDLNNGKCSQKSLFQKISQKLGDNKYFVTSKQCMTKLASMKSIRRLKTTTQSLEMIVKLGNIMK